jgi:N6-adenosine-specific RNA methylase IME4
MTAPARKPALPARREDGERARVLALYDAAVAALDRATKIDEVKKVGDVAEQIKLYARQARDTQIMVKGVDLRLRARRELGKLLVAAEQKGELAGKGWQKGRSRRPTNNVGKPDIIGKPAPVTLTVVGLTRDESAEAKKLAKVDDKTFGKLRREQFERIAAKGARLVSPQSDVLVRERKAQRRVEVVRLSENPLLLPDGPFAGGVGDPPWIDEERPIGWNKRHYGYHYPLMTVDKIAAMDVGRRFGKRAMILLWCTKHHVAIGSHVTVLRAWGFEPSTEFVWNKELRGLGNGFNVDVHESLILGLRGDVPAPDPENRPLSLFSIRKSRTHSLKPEWPQQQLERWLPGGAFIYLFAGNQPERKGWCLWGHPHGKGE